ncbi:hypothetical protein [Microbacterium hibisci]|uniref:hypothetical protein n=1 Tax=Microbacterium hibisci TaxID=2036000 RepID=UPI0019438FB6|nr:hypothetical protein [Microbacterium hibisci]
MTHGSASAWPASRPQPFDALLRRAADLELVAVADPPGRRRRSLLHARLRRRGRHVDAGGPGIVVLSTPIPTHTGLTRLAPARGVERVAWDARTVRDLGAL